MDQASSNSPGGTDLFQSFEIAWNTNASRAVDTLDWNQKHYYRGFLEFRASFRQPSVLIRYQTQRLDFNAILLLIPVFVVTAQVYE